MANRLWGVMTVAAFAAAGGCATSPTVSYSAINAPPRPFARHAPTDVDVFVGKPPARPAVDVGIFEVSGGSGLDAPGTTIEGLVASLRQHAALRGCDAVQVLAVDMEEGGYRVMRGVCEIYTDGQAQQAAGHPASAPPAPLPGEGKSCTPAEPGAQITGASSCPDPLVCTNHVCTSPYH
jgi:hypothetical protein